MDPEWVSTRGDAGIRPILVAEWADDRKPQHEVRSPSAELVCLRRDPRFSGIPLVVITGNDQILQDDCQSYLGSHQGVQGPDGGLGKPVDRQTLLAVLKHLPGPGVLV